MSKLEKIEKAVVEGYKKIEETTVNTFEDISDAFIEKHLMKDGETLEEAKARLAKENDERMKKQKEMIEKSIEASKNAGKR